MTAPTLAAQLDVTVDDGVTFMFRVTNVGSKPVDLRFRSGQLAEIVVEADDTAVWRSSEGRMYTQALQTRTVRSGDPLTVSDRWPDPQRGRFSATASLVARNADVQATATFEV